MAFANPTDRHALGWVRMRGGYRSEQASEDARSQRSICGASTVGLRPGGMRQRGVGWSGLMRLNWGASKRVVPCPLAMSITTSGSRLKIPARWRHPVSPTLHHWRGDRSCRMIAKKVVWMTVLWLTHRKRLRFRGHAPDGRRRHALESGRGRGHAALALAQEEPRQ